MAKQVHFMFVDDDRDDRQLFREAVSEINPKNIVTVFDNGFQLLKILKTFLPDMIFLDLNMPGMNGHACLEEIRKDRMYDKLIVVIYSTSSEPAIIDTAYQAGANFYIKKPSSFENIKRSISHLLSLYPKGLFPRPARERFLLQLDAAG